MIESTTLRNGEDPLIYDREQHDSLILDRGPVVAGLDWERDGWRVSVAGSSAVRVSREALLTDPLDGIDAVVVEAPHMRERNVYSVAQVYTEEELERLAFRKKVRLFPCALAPRAARYAGNVLPTDKPNVFKPDKTKDAESIAAYAVAHPAQLQSWKRYKLPHEDAARSKWTARDDLRDALREALNPLRVAWNGKLTAERYALPEVVRFCDLLNAQYDALTPEVRAQFGITRSKNGMRVARMPAAITLYLALYERDGTLRRCPKGHPYGTQFVLDAIGMSHSNKPNMARSQLTYHGLRHYKGTRCEYMRNIRRFLRVLRAGAPT